MGAGGRPRKPTAVKIAEGNRGKRKLPENEPKPPLAAPDCPADLSPVGKAEWNNVIDKLMLLKVISKADERALHLYCKAWEEFIKMEKIIEKEGMTFQNGAGGISAHPLISAREKMYRNALRFLTEFGLTPAARSKVSVNKTEDENHKARFFQGIPGGKRA